MNTEVPPIKTSDNTQGVLLEPEAVPTNSRSSHVVAGWGDYYIPMSRPTYEFGILMLLALVVVVLLMLILYAFQRQRRVTTSIARIQDLFRLRRRRPINPILENRGATSNEEGYTNVDDAINLQDEVTCSANPTSYWSSKKNSCFCFPPFWGSECQRESYNSQYLASGRILDSQDLEVVKIGDPRQVDRLSFPTRTNPGTQTTCTNICDELGPQCQGVLWDSEASLCTPFNQVIFNNGNDLTFNPNLDSELYLKNNTLGLRFTDRVFILTGKPHPRYFLIKQSFSFNGSHITAISGQRYRLTFYPTRTVNNGSLTGIYSTRPFSPSEYPYLLEKGDTPDVYIHYPGQDIKVPINWYYQVLWVMYK